MVTGDDIPIITQYDSLSNAIIEMNDKKLGFVIIVNESNKLYGIFTDGDLRRALSQKIELENAVINDFTNKNCVTSSADELVAKSLEKMKLHKINSIVVVNEENQILGAFNINQVLRHGINF